VQVKELTFQQDGAREGVMIGAFNPDLPDLKLLPAESQLFNGHFTSPRECCFESFKDGNRGEHALTGKWHGLGLQKI